MHMLKIRKLNTKKLFANRKRATLIGTIALLVVAVLIASLLYIFKESNKSNTDNNSANNSPVSMDTVISQKKYTLLDSNINCKMVSYVPDTPATQKVCEGNITLKADTGTETKYDLSESTLITKNNLPVTADELNAYKNQSLVLTLGVAPDNKNKLSDIIIQ